MAQTSFPVIPHALQNERDFDRRLILEAELQEEKAALADARARYANLPDTVEHESVHRHEENIKALRRELAGPTTHRGPRKASAIASHHEPAAMRQGAQLDRRAASLPGGRRASTPSGSGAPSNSWVIFADTAVSGSQPAQAVPNNAVAPATTPSLPLSAAVPQPAARDARQNVREQSEPAFVRLVR